MFVDFLPGKEYNKEWVKSSHFWIAVYQHGGKDARKHRNEIGRWKSIVKVEHPYITSKKDFYSGRPVIKGTKFPVRSVVVYILRQGMTPEELVKEFSHLSLAQVYDALSYYYDHKNEIDEDLASNTEEIWEKKTKDEKW